MTRAGVSIAFREPSEPSEPTGTGSLRRVAAESWEDLAGVLVPGREPSVAGRLTETGGLAACLACGHPELYTQKDFPRRLGVFCVVVAAVLAPFTHYLSLAVAALVDAVLYLVAPDVVVCYVCQAAHRGFPCPPRHPRFDREIDERLRYGARAVMGKPMQPGGTADAPDPEH